MGAGPQPPRKAGGAGDGVADPDLPARPGQLGQGGAGGQGGLGVGRPGRPPRWLAAAGGEQVQQPRDQAAPGTATGGEGVGGPAGPGQSPPSGGAGQDLDGGGLAVGELAGRAQHGAQRVDPVLGPQGLPGAGGQPQLPGQHPPNRQWGWGVGWGGGGGAGAGPAGLDGPLDQAGRDRARDPQADADAGGGPGELEADMGPGVQGTAEPEQPGQIPPQGFGGGRLDLGWGQDLDQPGTGGQPPLAPPGPAPAGRHDPCGQRDGHDGQPKPPARPSSSGLVGQLGQAAPRVGQESLPPARPRPTRAARGWLLGVAHHGGSPTPWARGGVGGEQGMLGRGGQGGEPGPLALRAGQQPLADGGGQQPLTPPLGQREGIGELLQGLGGLAEEDLGGGIGHHRPAQVACQEVGGVLGDHRQATGVFAGRFGQPIQEPGPGRLLGQGPGLVDHDQAPTPADGVADGSPQVIKGQQGPHPFELLSQLAQGEDQQVAVGRVLVGRSNGPRELPVT